MPALLTRLSEWLFRPRTSALDVAVQRAVGQTLQDFFFAGTTRDASAKKAELKRPLEQHVWMSAAMRIVAQNAVKAPLQFWEGEVGKGRLLKEDDPRVAVWRRPNPTMRGSGLIEAIFTHVWDQGYVGLVKQGKTGRSVKVNSVPQELWALPGRMFVPTFDSETNVPLKWTVDLGNRSVVFDPWEVLWIKRFNPYDPWSGLGMWQAALLSANQDFKAARMMDSFLAKDMQMGGVMKLSARSTPEQREQLAVRLKAKHQGPDKAGETLILGKDQEWIVNQATNRDMQYMDLREWNREEVLAAGGVPPMLVGVVGDYNLATAKTAMLTFLQHTLMPAATFVASEITADVQATWVGSEKVTAAFDFSVFPELTEVTTEVVSAANTLFGMGVPMNQINERLRMGLKKIVSGDTEFLPYTIVPAELVTGGQTFPVKPQLLDPEDNAELLHPSAAAAEPAAEDAKPDEEDDQDEDAIVPAGKAARALALARAARAALGMGKASILPRWHLYVAQVLTPVERSLARELRRYFWALKLHVAQLVREAFASKADAKPQRRLSRSMIDRIVFNHEKWAARLQDAVDPFLKEAAKRALDFASAELPKGVAVLDVGDPRVTRFLAEKSIEVRNITVRLREHLRHVLVNSVIEANTIAETQVKVLELVKDVSQNALARSLTIARTETAGAANGARHLELEERAKDPNSVVRRHQWVSANDDHVRLSHQKVDGEVVEIGKPFSNGLLYPGESGAPPEETINCRCVSVAVLDD